MAAVPRVQAKKIQYFQTHLGPFAEHAEQIGTTPEAVTDLQEKTVRARAAFSAARRARQAARAATLALKDAIEEMNAAGQAILQQVRAQAALTGENGVYTLAQVGRQAKPSPLGSPGTPTRFDVRLDSIGGTLTFTWACKHPANAKGTVYQVSRRTTPGGPFAFLGVTGTKSFTDETIPAGVTALTYEVRGVRSTAVGAAAQFNVYFGGHSARGGTAAVGAPKIAA